MKIDFSKPILDIDGNIILEKDTKKELTLKNVCVMALNTLPNDDRSSGEQKFKRYELSLNINSNDIVEVKSEDIVLLKKVIGEMYVPIVVGRAYDLLENNKD